MLTDTHCHFDFPEFSGQQDALMARLHDAGVERLLIPAVGEQGWAAQCTLARRYPGRVYVALGIHPYWVLKQSTQAFGILAKRLAENEVIAVGEAGLDPHADAPWERQLECFHEQCQLARHQDLPLIVHCRRQNHEEMLSLLGRMALPRGGVIHAFTGSLRQAQRYIELGFYLGVGGGITYPRAHKTRSAIAAVGAAHLLLETDAPDMPLCGFQREPNTPERLPLVCDALANLLAMPPDELALQLENNVAQLFQIGSI